MSTQQQHKLEEINSNSTLNSTSKIENPIRSGDSGVGSYDPSFSNQSQLPQGGMTTATESWNQANQPQKPTNATMAWNEANQPQHGYQGTNFQPSGGVLPGDSGIYQANSSVPTSTNTWVQAGPNMGVTNPQMQPQQQQPQVFHKHHQHQPSVSNIPPSTTTGYSTIGGSTGVVGTNQQPQSDWPKTTSESTTVPPNTGYANTGAVPLAVPIANADAHERFRMINRPILDRIEKNEKFREQFQSDSQTEESQLFKWIRSEDSQIPIEQREMVINSLKVNGVYSDKVASMLNEFEWAELIPMVGARASVREYLAKNKIQTATDLPYHMDKLQQFDTSKDKDNIIKEHPTETKRPVNPTFENNGAIPYSDVQGL